MGRPTGLLDSTGRAASRGSTTPTARRLGTGAVAKRATRDDNLSSFETTNWDLVFETRSEDREAQNALEELCRAYWGPLYAFTRRSGYDEETARDLVQGFFLHLVSRKSLDHADPVRGRFRNFLVSSLKNYVADQHDRESAKKRSPGTPLLSLDDRGPDSRQKIPDPVDRSTPETMYARRWAEKMVLRAVDQLGEEQKKRGRGELFQYTRSYLVDNEGPSYREVAERLGVTENAVKSAVRSQRKRLGSLLRDQVSEVLKDADSVDAELRQILRTLQES